MIFHLSNEFDRQRAKERFDFLLKNGKKIELKERKEKRTAPQNRYLHLILSWFAWEYGETQGYIKQEIFKKIVNEEIFKTEYINFKTGEIRTDWKSTADLNTQELTTAIERFRNYACKEAGIYLPEPSDLVYLEEIERNLSQQQAEKWVWVQWLVIKKIVVGRTDKKAPPIGRAIFQNE